MIFPLVREMAATSAPVRVPVAVACRVLGFSTQGYYKWLKEPVSSRERDDAGTINKLVDLHEDDPTLGYRFLTDELEEIGVICSENRVHRLCDIAGIQASHAKKKGKAGKPGPPVHDDLLATEDKHGQIRHVFSARRPDQVWLTDIERHEAPHNRAKVKDLRGPPVAAGGNKLGAA
ncbi:MAG: IS3 family transposase [Solirubrobacterales bacterium]